MKSYFVLVANIKFKRLHHSRNWALEKVVDF
jgi:hypothetical protein